jgi:hypothetical protein
VSGAQSCCDLAANLDCFALLDPSLPLESSLQRFPQQQPHGNERDAAVLTHFVDCHNIVVLNRNSCLRLSHELLSRRAVRGYQWLHGLQRNQSLKAGVFGEQHNAHAPHAQHIQDTVAAQSSDFIGSFGRSQEIDFLQVDLYAAPDP